MLKRREVRDDENIKRERESREIIKTHRKKTFSLPCTATG